MSFKQHEQDFAMEAGLSGKYNNMNWKGKVNHLGQSSWSAMWKANELLSAGISGSFNHATEDGIPSLQNVGMTFAIE